MNLSIPQHLLNKQTTKISFHVGRSLFICIFCLHTSWQHLRAVQSTSWIRELCSQHETLIYSQDWLKLQLQHQTNVPHNLVFNVITVAPD